MKTKLLFFGLLAGTALFTACQNELDDNSLNSELTDPISVTLRIAGGNSTTMSRVIDDDATSELTPNFNDAIIYFYDSSGHILNTEQVSSTTSLAGTTGQVFQDISPNATDVYIVGNTQTLTTDEQSSLSAATSIDAVQALVFDLESQQSDHQDVILAVKIDLENYADHDAEIKQNEDSDYEAKVLLAPSLSRLQLADLSTSDSRIVDFTFEGIYVDNFLPNCLASTTLTQTTSTQTVGTDATKLGTLTPNLCDKPESTLTAGDDKKVTAGECDNSGDDRVWGYNLSPTSAESGTVPKIVVHLTDVKYLDSQGTEQTMDDAYLTITKYMDGTTEITNFESGKMYNIEAGAFVFTYEDLDAVPNAEDVELTVYVTVCPWTVTTVTPQL